MTNCWPKKRQKVLIKDYTMKELMQKLKLLTESADPTAITNEDHWDDEQMSNDQAMEMLDKVYDYMVEKGVPKQALSQLLQFQQTLEQEFETISNSGDPYDHDSFGKDDADYINSQSDGTVDDEYDYFDHEKNGRDELDFEAVEHDDDSKWFNKDSKHNVKNTSDCDDNSKKEKRDYKRYDYSDDEIEEEKVAECPMDPIAIQPAQSQPSSSTMSINMNGTGKDGIKDLLNILRDIEDGPESSPASAMPHAAHGDTTLIVGDEEVQTEAHPFANSPEEKYSSIKDIMKSGNDLHKAKDSYSDKPYRGDNPMAIKETLKSLYQFVKSK